VTTTREAILFGLTLGMVLAGVIVLAVAYVTRNRP
jgi:hypothetical protein